MSRLNRLTAAHRFKGPQLLTATSKEQALVLRMNSLFPL